MGFTKVTVTHKYDTADGKTVKITDRITIAVLDPLLPVQPISGKTGKKFVKKIRLNQTHTFIISHGPSSETQPLEYVR